MVERQEIDYEWEIHEDLDSILNRIACAASQVARDLGRGNGILHHLPKVGFQMLVLLLLPSELRVSSGITREIRKRLSSRKYQDRGAGKNFICISRWDFTVISPSDGEPDQAVVEHWEYVAKYFLGHFLMLQEIGEDGEAMECRCGYGVTATYFFYGSLIRSSVDEESGEARRIYRWFRRFFGAELELFGQMTGDVDGLVYELQKCYMDSGWCPVGDNMIKGNSINMMIRTGLHNG